MTKSQLKGGADREVAADGGADDEVSAREVREEPRPHGTPTVWGPRLLTIKSTKASQSCGGQGATATVKKPWEPRPINALFPPGDGPGNGPRYRPPSPKTGFPTLTIESKPLSLPNRLVGLGNSRPQSD